MAEPEPGTTLDVALRRAESPDDALAKAFALAGPADVRQTWVAGTPIRQRVRPARRPLQTADESQGGGPERDSRASLDLAIAKPQPSATFSAAARRPRRGW